MVFIEELSRGPLIIHISQGDDHNVDQRKRRYASKASDSSCFRPEPYNENTTTGQHQQYHHYPLLLAIVPLVTLLYMAVTNNLKSNSDVLFFSLGVLSYVIGMDLTMSGTLSQADCFLE
jgi:hypothetical protein